MSNTNEEPKPVAEPTIDDDAGEQTAETVALINYRHQQMQRRSKYEPENFDQLMQYAEYIHQSNLCPGHINSAADVMLIVQQGTELGLSPMMALQNLYSIDGKVTLPAKMKVAVIKGSPECIYWRRVSADQDHATYETLRRGDPGPTQLTYTFDQAKAAGLTNKTNWKGYRAAMLRARCKSQLADDVYEDLLAGIYTPDEVGAETDANGVPLFDASGTPIVSNFGGVSGREKPKPHEWQPGEYEVDCSEADPGGWSEANEAFATAFDDAETRAKLQVLMRQRHGVSSWAHLPAFVLSWWTTAVTNKGAAPVLEWLASEVDVDLEDVHVETYGDDDEVIDAEFEEAEVEPADDSQTHWSEVDYSSEKSHDSKIAWEKANKRYHALTGVSDCAELQERFRDLIKTRHGVESWKQIPPEAMSRWCQALQNKSADVDGEPSERWDYMKSTLDEADAAEEAA